LKEVHSYTSKKAKVHIENAANKKTLSKSRKKAN